jgi:hypothetical protein
MVRVHTFNRFTDLGINQKSKTKLKSEAILLAFPTVFGFIWEDGGIYIYLQFSSLI